MNNEVSILILGFSDIEIKLMQGVCKLSERRGLKINILPETLENMKLADVLLVDYSIDSNIEKARQMMNFTNKPCLWVDRQTVSKNHINLQRPVQWTQIVGYITNALDAFKQQAHQNAPTSNAQKQTPNNAQQAPSSNQSYSSIDTVLDKVKQILIVDDSLVVRQQLQDILHKKGYKVTLAASGQEALDKFKPNYFDKILLDVVMPDVDGYETCRQIKSLEIGQQQTPIIMLTSKSSPFDKIKGKMAGCDAYLTKPVSLDRLLSSLTA